MASLSFRLRGLVFLFILLFLCVRFSLLLLSMILLGFGRLLCVTVTEAPVLGAFVISPTALLHDLFIGIRQLLEVFLVATFVWMTLHGNEPISLLDLSIRGTGGNAQDGVCGVLVKTSDFIHDFTLETHLPQDVFIQGSIQLLQMFAAQLVGLRLSLLRTQLQFMGQGQVAQHKVPLRFLHGGIAGDHQSFVSQRRLVQLQWSRISAESFDHLHCHLQFQVVLWRSSTAGMTPETHSAVDQGDLFHGEVGPVPIGPLSEAHQREGLPDGIRWVFLKDLIVQPFCIAVATHQGTQRSSKDL
mmetsp:Transcript_52058/g.113456  ORF Transcript_52058/g.113456 Transcript_52058/m.113456 type:complete len:300 (-) Transcript_52058:586-1485(-)